MTKHRRPCISAPRKVAKRPMAHSAILNVMIKAAYRAGKSLKRDLGEVENLQVSLKGPANFVCAADRRAEEIVREELFKARPDYGFLGEEGGARAGTDKTHRWIVDPLDGTTTNPRGARCTGGGKTGQNSWRRLKVRRPEAALVPSPLWPRPRFAGGWKKRRTCAHAPRQVGEAPCPIPPSSTS